MSSGMTLMLRTFFPMQRRTRYTNPSTLGLTAAWMPAWLSASLRSFEKNWRSAAMTNFATSLDQVISFCQYFILGLTDERFVAYKKNGRLLKQFTTEGASGRSI